MGEQRTGVMVTAAGSAPAVAVIQALREQPEIPVRIVAADMDPLAVGFHLAHERAAIPGARDPEFVDRVLEVCLERAVSVVFPIIDEELPLFAAAAPEFARHGIHVVTNSPAVVQTAGDKWETARWCRRHSIPAPRTWLAAEVPDG